VKSAADARRIAAFLREHHPNANTELRYRTPFELLAATILSAQSTDQRVNLVTPVLFARYPDAPALAAADLETLERIIHSTGFFRAKARALVGMANTLVAQHGGEVPPDITALTALPGVGRKTANVVLGHAFALPGLPVDRHVIRVANRIGLADGDDAEQVEQQLCGLMPPAEWTRFSDSLILHGRRICKPTPRCDDCLVQQDCRFAQEADGRNGEAGAVGRRPLKTRIRKKATRGSARVRTGRR
jgi:endonuclease-3